MRFFKKKMNKEYLLDKVLESQLLKAKKERITIYELHIFKIDFKALISEFERIDSDYYCIEYPSNKKIIIRSNVEFIIKEI